MIPDTGVLSILSQASMMDCFKKTVKSQKQLKEGK